MHHTFGELREIVWAEHRVDKRQLLEMQLTTVRFWFFKAKFFENFKKVFNYKYYYLNGLIGKVYINRKEDKWVCTRRNKIFTLYFKIEE